LHPATAKPTRAASGEIALQKFAFRLQRVLDYQSQVRDIESHKLQVMAAALTSLENRIASLEQWIRSETIAIQSRKTLHGADLAQHSQFEQLARDEKRRLIRQRAEVERQNAAQREKVLRLDQKVELMQRLKNMQWEEWTLAANVEQEQIATELFLARRVRSQSQVARGGNAGGSPQSR
jgi:hypothetical protein